MDWWTRYQGRGVTTSGSFVLQKPSWFCGDLSCVGRLRSYPKRNWYCIGSVERHIFIWQKSRLLFDHAENRMPGVCWCGAAVPPFWPSTVPCLFGVFQDSDNVGCLHTSTNKCVDSNLAGYGSHSRCLHAAFDRLSVYLTHR